MSRICDHHRGGQADVDFGQSLPWVLPHNYAQVNVVLHYEISNIRGQSGLDVQLDARKLMAIFLEDCRQEIRGHRTACAHRNASGSAGSDIRYGALRLVGEPKNV